MNKYLLYHQTAWVNKIIVDFFHTALQIRQHTKVEHQSVEAFCFTQIKTHKVEETTKWEWKCIQYFQTETTDKMIFSV